MNKRAKYIGWVALLAVAVTAFVMIFIPVWLIQPFAPQTEESLAISYLIKSWSPIVTPILMAIGLVVAFIIWRNSARWFGKALLVFPLAFIGLFTWFSYQNHFEWMFNPLKNSAYVKAADVDFTKGPEMVLAVEMNGESVAYPVTLMAYHHLVSDVVGGKPITATY